jgi:WD40 repeat protein
MMEFAKHDPNAARRFDLWHRHGFSVHTAGLLTGVREDAVVRDLTLAASWLTITTRSPTRGCRGRLFVSSPDGTRAMIVEGGGPARIVEQPGGRSVATLKCDPPFFETAWFMNQGDRLLTISDDGAVRVWNARSGLQLVGPRATAPEVIRD